MTSAWLGTADQNRLWLFEHALPLWWDIGADRQGGGFVERIDQSGRPMADHRRIRVQARQIYVYAEAGRLGWSGPWRAAVHHGLDYLLRAYRRSDGLFRTLVDAEGRVRDDRALLYDQAFVLLALAHAHAALGQPVRLRQAGEDLLARLTGRFAHPLFGFREIPPATAPLLANPHMHMLEALLAWMDSGGDDHFRQPAEGIVRLALQCLVDPVSGSIGEYFDPDWRPVEGPGSELREPGHQFEWAFLLRQAQVRLGIDPGDRPERLMLFGERHGIHPDTGAVIFAVSRTGQPLDPDARLWAQTERLRAHLRAGDGPLSDRRQDGQAVTRTFGVLNRFLDVPVAGLWLDRMHPDGRLVSEPAPASSLYHLMSALSATL